MTGHVCSLDLHNINRKDAKDASMISINGKYIKNIGV